MDNPKLALSVIELDAMWFVMECFAPALEAMMPKLTEHAVSSPHKQDAMVAASVSLVLAELAYRRSLKAQSAPTQTRTTSTKPSVN